MGCGASKQTGSFKQYAEKSQDADEKPSPAKDPTPTKDESFKALRTAEPAPSADDLPPQPEVFVRLLGPAGRLPLKGNVRWTLDGAAVALPATPPAALKIYDVKDTCHVVIETLAAGRHVVGVSFAPPAGAVEKAARGRKTGAPYAGLTHLIFY